MLIESVRKMIGVPPVGYEWIEYTVAAVFFVFLFQSAWTFLDSIVKTFR